MNTTDTQEITEETTGVTLQVLLTISIFLINLIFGLVPLFCKKCILNSSFIGIANAFSGGIFLSTGLFHLIPESLEKFEDHWEKNPDSSLAKYPNTLFLACMSYVLILFVEKVAVDSHSLLSYGHSHQHHNHEALSQCNDVANPNSGRNNNHSHGNEIEIPEANTVIHINSKRDRQKKNTKKKKSSSVSENRNPPNNSFIMQGDIESQPNEVEQTPKGKKEKGLSKKKKNENKQEKPSELQKTVQQTETENPSQVSTTTTFVLLIALSIHGFFEGIAMGLQTHKDEFIIIYVAIICHKWAESFTLGQSLSKSPMTLKISLSLVILFAFITPAGVILGIYVSDTNKLVEAIMLGLSGGTFLYISTTEVIVEEFSINKHKYFKFLALIVAIIVIAITKIVEEQDGHSH